MYACTPVKPYLKGPKYAIAKPQPIDCTLNQGQTYMKCEPAQGTLLDSVEPIVHPTSTRTTGTQRKSILRTILHLSSRVIPSSGLYTYLEQNAPLATAIRKHYTHARIRQPI